jgi:intraflagellar transport protein 172
MYQQNGSWEDAVRCCKMYGSDKETCELAKQWAETLGPDAGMKILLKFNLIDAVIEYLCDRKEFEEAFRMAQKAIHKKPDVHLKFAFDLEDGKRYKEAEEHFIKAGKPEEAINMYEHLNDFQSALQVAKIH